MEHEKHELRNRYFYMGLTAFLVIAACVLFYFLLAHFSGIVSRLGTFFQVMQPIIIGLVIAFLVDPIADFVQKGLHKAVDKHMNGNRIAKKVSNGISVISAMAVFVVFLFLIFYLIVPQFFSSIMSMIKYLPGQLENLTNRITAEFDKNEQLRDVVNVIYEYGKKWLQNDLASYINTAATYFATGILNVLSFAKNFVFGLIFAMYLLFNKRILMRQTRKLMFAIGKRSHVEKLFAIGRKTHRIFSGFIYGKLLDSVIIGILCFIGVTVLKMPYTMLIAVIIGVTNIIPVFGPYIGAIPCSALILLYDPFKGVSFIIFIILLQIFDGNFLGPKILGNSTGLSAFWVVFAILVGGGLFGVFGMLLGVPLFAVIYYLTSTFINMLIRKKQLPQNTAFYDENVCEKLEGAEELQLTIPLEEEEPANEQ